MPIDLTKPFLELLEKKTPGADIARRVPLMKSVEVPLRA